MVEAEPTHPRRAPGHSHWSVSFPGVLSKISFAVSPHSVGRIRQSRPFYLPRSWTRARGVSNTIGNYCMLWRNNYYCRQTKPVCNKNWNNSSCCNNYCNKVVNPVPWEPPCAWKCDRIFPLLRSISCRALFQDNILLLRCFNSAKTWLN